MRPLRSLRAGLLVGIIGPVSLLVVFNTVSLYRQARAAADTAYDRTLLASAKSIGELLELVDDGQGPHVRGSVVYSALEAFEADNRSRIFYKVTGFEGEMVSGFSDMPSPHASNGESNVYSALVHFYDDVYQDRPVRVALLLQPVAGVQARGMATVQVAETLEVRNMLARQILIQTLWRQALLLAVIATVVVAVVQRATRPVRDVSARLQGRDESDLSPLPTTDALHELRPLLDATNSVMARLARLLQQQKRFVRDASHELRTPLAVLKTQLQSAQRGDVAPAQAFEEMAVTVEQATELANQMLALAKVEQLRLQGDAPIVNWAQVVRAVALDLSALIAQAALDFDLELRDAPVRAHEWNLRELTRNLMHNAIKYSPSGGRLTVRMLCDSRAVALIISDSGPGLSTDVRQRLFQPFATGNYRSGAGLGLTLCRDIVDSLGGSIELVDRMHAGRKDGLDAVVRLLLAEEQLDHAGA
jgi:two-component system, OmpR family, sensor histidine kinase TctE